MKFDLGCGYKKREGFVRVDQDSHVVPDILHDLDVLPWPIESDCAEELCMMHILEHLAPLPNDYRRLWQEIYRICKPEAKIVIEVPHWAHDTFFADPTHVRPITPVTIAMMDQQRNLADIASGGCESTLGLQWNVDFALDTVGYGTDNMSGLPVICRYNVTAKKPERKCLSKS